MFDQAFAADVLRQILHAIELIEERFTSISSPHDFIETAAGREKLDAICMPLCAIGESLKNLDKATNGNLLPKYPSIDWRGAKTMRDIIAHHYFDIDEEIVFNVCDQLLPPMADVIRTMIHDLDS